jgi:hypothetical protein
MQLYHCDVDTLLQEPKGGVASSKFSLCLDSARLESFDEIPRDIRMIPPGPNSTSETDDVAKWPLHCVYLIKYTHLLMKSRWNRTGSYLNTRIKNLNALAHSKTSPKSWNCWIFPKVTDYVSWGRLQSYRTFPVICSVVPDLEPTCLTSVIQAMVM